MNDQLYQHIKIIDWNIKESDEEVARRPFLKTVDQPKGAVEVTNMRRLNSKTFKLGGDNYRYVKTLSPIHYFQNGAWENIDLSFVEDLNSYTVEKAPYDLVVSKEKIYFKHTSKLVGSVEVELISVGSVNVKSLPEPRLHNNIIYWDDVIEGLHIKLQVFPKSVTIFKKVDYPEARNKLRWKITEQKNGEARFIPKIFGVDNKKDSLEIITKKVDEREIEKDGRLYSEYILEEEWTGRVSRVIDRSTRQKDWGGTAEFPVVIDASTVEDVTSGADDIIERLDNATIFTGYFRVGMAYTYFGEQYTNGGVRFQSVTVPQGATINSATLSMKFLSVGSSGNVKFDLYGDDVDDAPAWSGSSKPSQITKTTAGGIHTATGTGSKDYGVTGIVQEIISRPGWGSGNDIRFGLFNTKTGHGFATKTYIINISDYPGVDAAVLSIDYTASGGGEEESTVIKDLIGGTGFIPHPR